MQKRYLAIAIFFMAASSPVMALNLKEAILRAEQIDPQVQSAIANSDAAQAGIQIARSKLLPTVQGVGSYGRTNQTSNQVDPNYGLYSQKYVNSTPNSQVFLKQALFRMSEWTGLNISQMQTEYGLFKLASAYGDLWLRVSNAWFDLVAAQEAFAIQVESERAMNLVSEQAQKAFDAGVGTRDSAVEAKAQLAFSRSNALEAKLILASRQKAFQTLTGFSLEEVSNVSIKFANRYRSLTGNEKSFIAKINEVSPEILAVNMAEVIRKIQVQQAKYGSYPPVDFFASYQQTQNYNINQIGLGVISSQAAVQLTIPFYSGGLYAGQERQAAAYLEAATADKKAAELRLTTAAQTYWATQEAQLDRSIAVQEMVSAGQEVVKAYRMGVTAGTKSWSDVGNAEVVLTKRRVDQVTAIASLLKAQAQLLSVLPVTDEAWHQWLNAMVFDGKKSK